MDLYWMNMSRNISYKPLQKNNGYGLSFPTLCQLNDMLHEVFTSSTDVIFKIEDDSNDMSAGIGLPKQMEE